MKMKGWLSPLGYEEDIREEGWSFIRFVRDVSGYRKKYERGYGKHRRIIYSRETYKRVKWGEYGYVYLRKKQSR